MKSTEELLSLVESTFLTISLEARYQQSTMSGCSTKEAFKMFRAAVCDELMQKLRPEVEKYLEEHYVAVKKCPDCPPGTD